MKVVETRNDSFSFERFLHNLKRNFSPQLGLCLLKLVFLLTLTSWSITHHCAGHVRLDRGWNWALHQRSRVVHRQPQQTDGEKEGDYNFPAAFSLFHTLIPTVSAAHDYIIIPYDVYLPIQTFSSASDWPICWYQVDAGAQKGTLVLLCLFMSMSMSSYDSCSDCRCRWLWRISVAADISSLNLSVWCWILAHGITLSSSPSLLYSVSLLQVELTRNICHTLII